MNGKSLWKFVPPAGPVLSLLLIGLVLLSGLLYYRSVKIQRFLEPALAFSQPRYEFSRSISRIFEREFGAKSAKGLKVRTSSILIEKSLLFSGDGALDAGAPDALRKLARIFLSLMEDDHTRSDISLVLIIARFPSYGIREVDIRERVKVQRMTAFIQDSLFHAEPELWRKYATFFAISAQPANPLEGNRELIEFRIVPSEFLHIEALEKLEKYSR
jgi:hypothetical protein